MPSRLLLPVLLLTCLPVLAATPTPDALPDRLAKNAASLRDQALKQSQAYATLASLTAEVGPRLAGSPGDRAAVAWAITRLQDLGFENVHAEKVVVPHWDRGITQVEITSPFPQALIATALGGSIGTGEEGIEAPVLAVKNLDSLEKLKPADVDGKILYFSQRMERTRDGSGYGKAVPVRYGAAIAGAKLGAVAVLIRSIGTGNDRFAHTGAMAYDDNVRQIPAAALSNPDADQLEQALATGQTVTAHLTMTARRLAPAVSANVIGDIPGDSDQIVLLGAHLDAWDLGTGAIDDGAGVAIVTEAARLVRKLGGKPRRSLRVVLFANEEFGLSGAKAYAKAHADELDRHVLAMEADFGAGRVWRLGSHVAPEALPKVEAMQQLLAPLGVTERQAGNDAEGGADIGPLAAAGVPILSPSQDGTFYFDYHHTANDTLDKINRDSLNQNVATYATLAFIVANLPDTLGRIETADSH